MELHEKFINALRDLDADECIRLLDTALNDQSISIDDAIMLVASALGLTVNCALDEIWTEHAKTQIVRSAIELISIYIIRTIPKNKHKNIAVVCPNGEYHELGARIVSDVIRKEGYNALFLGNSLPNSDIINLVQGSELSAIVFSISNFYSLHQINPVIQQINELKPNLPIILGGKAVENNPDQIKGNNIHLSISFDQLIESLKVSQ